MSEPTKVEIVDVSPQVLETVAGAAPASAEPKPLPLQPSVAPKTTEQEDITLAGQRRISLIWESTQAIIALLVIASNMFAALWNVVHGITVDVPLILSSSLFLVIGFYFARTNHQAIGGVGRKASDGQEYRGR